MKTEQRSMMMGTGGWMESEEEMGDRLESMMRCIESKRWCTRTHIRTYQNPCFSIVVSQAVFVNVTRCLLKFEKKNTDSNL